MLISGDSLFQKRHSNRILTHSRGKRTTDQEELLDLKTLQFNESLYSYPVATNKHSRLCYDLPGLRDLVTQLVLHPESLDQILFLVGLFPLPLADFVVSQMGYIILFGFYSSTCCIVYHVGGTSGSNAFYLCSKRTSEDKSDSSSAGGCRKADSMHMHLRMFFLYGTNLIKTLSRNSTDSFTQHFLNLSFPSITKVCTFTFAILIVGN